MSAMVDTISIILTTTTPNPTNDSRPTPAGLTPTGQLNSGSSSSSSNSNSSSNSSSNNIGSCGVGDEEKEDEVVTTVTHAATDAATVTDAGTDASNDTAAATDAAAVVPTTTTSTLMTCTHTKRRTMNMNAVNTLLYIRKQNNGGHPIHGDVQHVVKMYQCPDIVNRNSINYQLRLLLKQQQKQQQESKNNTNNKKRKLQVTKVATLSSPIIDNNNNKKRNVQTVNFATLSPPITNDKKKKQKAKDATVTAKVAASVAVPASAAAAAATTTTTNQSPAKKLNTTSATHKKHGTGSLLNMTAPIEVEVQRGLENIGTIKNNKDTVTVTKETTTRAMRRSLNVDAVKTLLQIRKQNGGPKHGDISDVVHMFHCPDIVNRNSINYQLQVLQNNGNVLDGNDDHNDNVLVEVLASSTKKKKLKEKDTTDVAKLSSPIINNVATLPPPPTIIKNKKQKDKSAVTEIEVVTTTEGTNRTSNDTKQKSTSSIRTKRGISAVSNLIANDDEEVEALDTDTTDERKIHGQQRSVRVCSVQNEVTTTTTINNNKPNLLVRRTLMKSAMDILLTMRSKNNNAPKHGDVQKVIEMFNFPDVVNRNSINYQLHLLKTKNGNNNNDGQYDVVPEPDE